MAEYYDDEYTDEKNLWKHIGMYNSNSKSLGVSLVHHQTSILVGTGADTWMATCHHWISSELATFIRFP